MKTRLIITSLCVFMAVQFATARQTIEYTPATQEWLKRGNAKLVYGLDKASFSAFKVTEDGILAHNVINNTILFVNNNGVIKEQWKLKNDTGPFSDGIFYQVDQDLYQYGTLLPGTGKMSKVVMETDTDKLTANRKNVSRNPGVKNIFLRTVRDIIFGDYKLTYNAQNDPESIPFSVYYTPSGKNSTKRKAGELISTGEPGTGTASRNPGLVVLDMEVSGSKLYLLNAYDNTISCYNQALNKEKQVALNTLITDIKKPRPSGAGNFLSLNNPIWLIADQKDGGLYIVLHTNKSEGKLTEIYKISKELDDALLLFSKPGYYKCHDIYDGHAYFLLPGEKISDPEHLKKDLAFSGRYTYIYKLDLYGDDS